mmetsp:Transcript_70652/g.216531  ORF Transcript_70652/g.216531 Transcript_70652/m.216531 type:complete len:202 (+) Transcript_70652:800-1405(+)
MHEIHEHLQHRGVQDGDSRMHAHVNDHAAEIDQGKDEPQLPVLLFGTHLLLVFEHVRHEGADLRLHRQGRVSPRHIQDVLDGLLVVLQQHVSAVDRDGGGLGVGLLVVPREDETHQSKSNIENVHRFEQVKGLLHVLQLMRLHVRHILYHLPPLHPAPANRHQDGGHIEGGQRRDHDIHNGPSGAVLAGHRHEGGCTAGAQ